MHEVTLASTEHYAVAYKSEPDPVIISLLDDNFEQLASCKALGVYSTVLLISLPILCRAIDSAAQDETWLQTSAFEFITALLKGRGWDAAPQRIFSLLGPSLFVCMSHASDRDVLQVNEHHLLHAV